jgi:hypothetical protein
VEKERKEFSCSSALKTINKPRVGVDVCLKKSFMCNQQDYVAFSALTSVALESEMSFIILKKI